MEWNEETKTSLASCNCAHREDVLSALAHIETLESLVTQAAELTQSRATAFAGIAEVILLEEPVSEKADLVQRINKYLFCAKEQGGSAVLLKEAKALLEKGEPKNG